MKKVCLFIFCTTGSLLLCFSACQSQSWNQLGNDIDGEASQDYSGGNNIISQTINAAPISLSSDGQTVAIGASLNDGNGDQSGHVRIYNWNGSVWIQLGEDIDGEGEEDYSGNAVSLSSDGHTVAIGATEFSLDPNACPLCGGYVRIYNWNGSAWTQLGSDIDGEGFLDENGRAVSLSSDGLTVAIGAKLDGNGSFNNSFSGRVRVYHWSGSEWIQLGNDIYGEEENDVSGNAVSLSSDGQTVAIGAPYNDGNGIASGHVRIYKWSGSSWTQLGSDIDGEEETDLSGNAVSLSSDGQTVAIGAPGGIQNGQLNGPGYVRIYHWSGSEWIQLGNDIYGEEEGDISGSSVSLSSDGQTVAIGASSNDGNGNNSGHVRVYNWSGSAWLQVGFDIDGEEEGDISGSSVSLSSDGQTVAIGAPRNDGNGNSSGHVRIYTTRLGCTDVTACNYSPVATEDDGSCEDLDDCGVCGGNGTFAGCTDSSACNYDSLADCDDGSCTIDDACGICGGTGTFAGCTDSSACNYDPIADCDDGSCTIDDECSICGGPGAIYECGCFDIPNGDCDCDGNILDALGICGGTCASDADNDGICDNEDPCIGVIDECGVCNGPGAVYQCGCSDIPEGDCDCDGTPLSPVVLECDCDEAITNLVEETITNFDDCTITEACYCECINDTDQDGVCDELEWAGCQDQSACNYSPNSTDEDNSLCIYPGSDCDDLNPLTFLDYVNEDCFCGGFEVTGIDENSTSSISVYPNPCSSSFIINTGRKPQYSDYRLYDMTGKEVQRGFVGSGITNIEINTLASGIYTLVILSKDGDAFRQSLVVQREE